MSKESTRALVRPSCLAGLALALLTPAVSAQSIVTVDAAGGPGADFTNLAQALALVEEGGLVILRDGDYPPFIVSGQSVAIVAEEGHTPVIRGHLRVDGVQSGQAVVLRGLTVEADDLSYAGTFERNEGPVHVEDCTFRAGTGIFATGGLIVGDSDSVTFVDVDVQAKSATGIGRDALIVHDSEVFLFGGSYLGADAPTAYKNAIDGSDAVEAFNSLVGVFGSELRGGAGGSTFAIGPCNVGGDGGVGLRINGGTPRAIRLDAIIEGGAPGAASKQNCDDGQPGLDVSLESGWYDPRPGFSRDFATTPIVRQGDQLVETFTGLPGEAVWIARSSTLGFGLEYPDAEATFHLGTDLAFRFRGIVPAGGTFSTASTLGPLDRPVVPLVEQALFIDMDTMKIVFAPPAVSMLIDG